MHVKGDIMRLTAVWPVLLFVVILIVVDEFISFLVLYLPPLDWLGDFSFLDYIMNIIRGCIELFFAIFHVTFMVPGAIWLFSIDELILAGVDVVMEVMALIGFILEPVVGDFVKNMVRIILTLIFGAFLANLAMALLYPAERTPEQKKHYEDWIKDFSKKFRH